MFTAPTKPVDQMTEEERRQFKDWLLEQGRNPRPIAVDRLPSGSVYIFDRNVEAVVECASDGSRHVVEVRDGRIRRKNQLVEEPLADSVTNSTQLENGSGPPFAFWSLAIIFLIIVLGQGWGSDGVRSGVGVRVKPLDIAPWQQAIEIKQQAYSVSPDR